MTRILATIAFCLLGTTAAFAADQAAATACAAKLQPDSKMIYAAVAPKVTPASVLKDVIRDTVKPMVSAGKISRSAAQAAAPSAGECLKLLK